MSAVLQDDLEMRAMEIRDIGNIVEIESSAYQFPWSASVFSDCLKAGYLGRVCSLEGVLVGYGIMSIGAGECHVLNLCVHPVNQGQSIGTRIMLDLMEIAKRSSVRLCFLEVRVSNTRARALYQALGFNEVGLRKGYYPDKTGREDAFVLAKTL